MPEKNLYQRMLAITEDAGAIGKTGKAASNMGGYEYHKIDDVEEHLRPLLVKHGVVAAPTLVSHTTESNPTGKGSQVQFITEAVVDIHFINADNPEERLTVQSLGQGIDYSDKGPGKAISYAVKTAYLCAFHLKGQPDPEQDDHERKPKAKGKAPKPAQKASGNGNGEYTFPRGEHKGKAISAVPADYLERLLDETVPDDDNRKLLELWQAELLRREGRAA